MTGRPKIIWFGRPPIEKDYLEAKNRNLKIECYVKGSEPDFSSAREVVFWATPPHFEDAISRLEDYCVAAYDLGLYIFVVVADSDVQRQEVQDILDRHLPYAISEDEYKIRIGAVENHEAPNRALMHNAGPSPNTNLEIIGDTGLLTEIDKKLLKRAFHDCKSIKLEIITSGLSGALTFSVAAKLSITYAGENPKPFFVKLDRTDKLASELRAYTHYAENHIDWYLRPNFIPNKCLHGATRGILVGSFVQRSSSLFNEVFLGNGPVLIRSLFIETLGLLREDKDTPQSIRHASVVEPLKQFCDFARIKNQRIENARKFGGNIHTPIELWRKLINLPPTIWRNSIIHGDMHGENVRIRNQDAIVIDFAHATNGPSCADLASLEVWLSFKSHPESKISFDKWQSQVEKIYDPENIGFALNRDTPQGHEIDWLNSCINEIRSLAKQSIHNSDEYKRVLAVYLLRHASYKASESFALHDEKRKSYAYWLANRLVISLCINQIRELELA